MDPSDLDLGQHGGKPTTVASLEDPFEPLRDIPDEGNNILTFRALAIGVLCGALINASNIYLGLKSGWSVSANLFAVCAGGCSNSDAQSGAITRAHESLLTWWCHGCSPSLPSLC